MIYTESEWKKSKLYQSFKEEATKDAREEVRKQLEEEFKQKVEQKVEQEVKQKVEEEIKQKVERSVLGLLKLGLTVEQIATGLDLSIATVQQIRDEQ